MRATFSLFPRRQSYKKCYCDVHVHIRIANGALSQWKDSLTRNNRHTKRWAEHQDQRSTHPQPFHVEFRPQLQSSTTFALYFFLPQPIRDRFFSQDQPVPHLIKFPSFSSTRGSSALSHLVQCSVTSSALSMGSRASTALDKTYLHSAALMVSIASVPPVPVILMLALATRAFGREDGDAPPKIWRAHNLWSKKDNCFVHNFRAYKQAIERARDWVRISTTRGGWLQKKLISALTSTSTADSRFRPSQ